MFHFRPTFHSLPAHLTRWQKLQKQRLTLDSILTFWRLGAKKRFREPLSIPFYGLPVGRPERPLEMVNDIETLHCYLPEWLISETEKVPQRTFATKILPNFRVNFLVRFASKPFFYRVVPSNCSEDSLVLFVHFFWLWGSFFGAI